jgi:hypothetical protein
MQTVIVLKTPDDMKIIKVGTIKSRTTISLENLVTMRPIGLESKNRMFALSTRSLTVLCRLVADDKIIQNTIAALKTVNEINSKILPINIPA